jgi:hypothetical protein
VTTACLAAALTATGCGKKGPPLAPVYMIPNAVSELSARRAEDSIRLRFQLPTQNVNGPGIDLARVEIYAVTVGAGADTPPNRDLLTRTYLAGQIDVKPPPVEGEPDAVTAADKRPAPGEIVTFVEQLTDRVLTPAPVKPAATPRGAADPSRPPPPITLPPPTDTITAAQPARVYVVLGVARNGRNGPPSSRVTVPLGHLPDAPGGLSVRNTEKAVVLDWLPAVAALGLAAPTYNVYRADAPQEPINRTPLATPSFEQAGMPLGTEVCFRVRSVHAAAGVSVESPLSDPICVTPADVFPPAAPKGLAAVASEGAVQLIWDANTDSDLAGYLVLRAEAPDETLQPLTAAPIRETVFRDDTIKPGARYVYAIVAVDSASQPNRSAPSDRVEVVAR